MKFLWRYGRELCYTLELIQTLYAQSDKENGVNFHNSVFPGEAKMCLDFMSFRATSAALKQKNYHNSANVQWMNMAMNEWKKKYVDLQRTWVSKRTVTQFPAVSLEEFHFKMLSWPVRDVANYASCISAISLPIYNRIQICFLYRNNQTNFIHILQLYITHMRCSRENAAIHCALFAPPPNMLPFIAKFQVLFKFMKRHL